MIFRLTLTQFSAPDTDPALSIVQQHWSALSRHFTALSASLASPLDNLASIPKSKSDISARAKHTRQLHRRLERQTEALTAARTKATTLHSLDSARASEARLDIEFHAQAHAELTALAHEEEALLATEERLYRTDLFLSVLKGLEAFAADRVQPCFAASEAALQVALSAAALPAIADAEVDGLERMLDELQRELEES